MFDNAPNKNEHYLKTLKDDFSFGRAARAIGGMFTSFDYEPNEGKQTTRMSLRT